MISIIDRCEQKYLLSEQKFQDFMHKMVDKMEKDKYFSETIYNIYFDNDEYELINKSLEKPEYKEKIRLRSYDMVNDNSLVFLEIKKKYLSHTNKRRVIISYKDYLDFINNGIIPNCDKQIMNEIKYCFYKYHLKPKIKIKYDRLSFYLKDDINFRITFDNNIRFNTKKDFNDYSDDNLLFKEGYIMEIKTFNGIPLWFNKILTELEIFPTSYSKVGKVYEGGLI